MGADAIAGGAAGGVGDLKSSARQERPRQRAVAAAKGLARVDLALLTPLAGQTVPTGERSRCKGLILRQVKRRLADCVSLANFAFCAETSRLCGRSSCAQYCPRSRHAFLQRLLRRTTSVHWQSEFRENRNHHETILEGLPRNCGPTDRTPNFPEDWKRREGGLQSLPRNCVLETEGLCPDCARIKAQIRLGFPDAVRRTMLTSAECWQFGCLCAACSRATIDHHPLYLSDPTPADRRGIHLHPRCHELWLEAVNGQPAARTRF